MLLGIRKGSSERCVVTVTVVLVLSGGRAACVNGCTHPRRSVLARRGCRGRYVPFVGQPTCAFQLAFPAQNMEFAFWVPPSTFSFHCTWHIQHFLKLLWRPDVGDRRQPLSFCFFLSRQSTYPYLSLTTSLLSPRVTGFGYDSLTSLL